MPAGRAQEDFTGKEAQAGRGAGRSKTVGAWETGEGEQVPPPRQSLPNGDIHHGPVHGCPPVTPPGTATAREGRRGGGCRQKGTGIPAKARVGWGAGKEQGVWSVGDRGGGTSSPSPSAPPPVAISTRSSTWGDSGEKPGTVAHRLHPGYGFPPSIATHGPRPREGAGEERRRRGWGGGCRQKRMLNQQEARARDAGEK